MAQAPSWEDLRVTLPPDVVETVEALYAGSIIYIPMPPKQRARISLPPAIIEELQKQAPGCHLWIPKARSK